jgi:plastocyanin
MSKKKGKVVAKKTAKKTAKTAAKKVVKKAASRSRATARLTGGAEPAGRTLHVSIFIFKTDRGTQIRTAPQRLYANPGDFVEWTVVNMVDGSNVPVTISWPETGPWGKEPIQVQNWTRMAFGASPAGNFKFVVSALDAQEDPEIEIPDGN